MNTLDVFLAKHKSNPILFCVRSHSGKVGFLAGLDIVAAIKMPASVNRAQRPKHTCVVHFA